MQELAVFAMELYRLHHWDPKLFEVTGELSIRMRPYGLVMSFIIMALKMCYGLDGRQNVAEFAPPRPASWTDWGERIMKRIWPPRYLWPMADEVCIM